MTRHMAQIFSLLALQQSAAVSGTKCPFMESINNQIKALFLHYECTADLFHYGLPSSTHIKHNQNTSVNPIFLADDYLESQVGMFASHTSRMQTETSSLFIFSPSFLSFTSSSTLPSAVPPLLTRAQKLTHTPPRCGAK